eukprot:TRINITY_DN10994_c0_g2_i1.p1 TRINITY_DN10994_c0_g2~~TRINITY_DN10994_c0_g2_i1.p1  ORF type:complete len:432 (+),score=103.38 TRINITY_DN10994_c0_g2_i1:99-1298(+)
MSNAMRAIRRKDSFNRMDKLAEQVEKWFFTSPVLEKAVNTMIASMSEAFVEDDEGDDTVGGVKGWKLFRRRKFDEKEKCMGEVMHAIKPIHAEFEENFEELVLSLVQSLGVTPEEFKEICVLTAEEEAVSGNHFYRWHEATNFTIFHEVLTETHENENPDTQPITKLRSAISTLSETAKINFRRGHLILPVIDKWDAECFEELLEFLDRPDTPKPDMGLRRRKDLARWRVRIQAKKLNVHSGYTHPGVDKEEWASYVAKWSQGFETEEVFENFHHSLRMHVKNLPLDTVGKRVRRAAWETFSSLDPRCRRKVPLAAVASLLEALSSPSFPYTKAVKKIVSRYTTSSQDHEQPLSVPSMSLATFREFLREVVGDDGSQDARDEAYIEFAEILRDKAHERY